MWSLGCVLAELVILRPLLEGEDTGDQLASIVDILGVPSDEDLENMRVEDNMLAQAVRASQVRVRGSSGWSGEVQVKVGHWAPIFFHPNTF